jgi:hypothetical protein
MHLQQPLRIINLVLDIIMIMINNYDDPMQCQLGQCFQGEFTVPLDEILGLVATYSILKLKNNNTIKYYGK